MYSGTPGQNMMDVSEFLERVKAAAPELEWSLDGVAALTGESIVTAYLGPSAHSKDNLWAHQFGELFGYLRFHNNPGKVSAEFTVIDKDDDVVEVRAASAKTLEELIDGMSLKLFRGSISIFAVPQDHPARVRLIQLGVEPMMHALYVRPESGPQDQPQAVVEEIVDAGSDRAAELMFGPLAAAAKALGEASDVDSFEAARIAFVGAIKDVAVSLPFLEALIESSAQTAVGATQEQVATVIGMLRTLVAEVISFLEFTPEPKFLKKRLARIVGLRSQIQGFANDPRSGGSIKKYMTGPWFDCGLALSILAHARTRSMYQDYDKLGDSVLVPLPAQMLNDELRLAGVDIIDDPATDPGDRKLHDAKSDAKRIGRLWSFIIMARRVLNFGSKIGDMFAPESEETPASEAN